MFYRKTPLLLVTQEGINLLLKMEWGVRDFNPALNLDQPIEASCRKEIRLPRKFFAFLRM
jgi:hypothetical protein